MYPVFMDDARRSRGYLTIPELEDLVGRGNIVFDAFSVLISRGVRIGSGNVFHSGVHMATSASGTIHIGDRNTFHSQTLLECSHGAIAIGSGNQFGEGGFTAKANRPDAAITIGDAGRYVGGASIFGVSRLGTGSQILGAITVDSCTLDAGAPFTNPDPDLRAGLLKGSGTARGITVPTGCVLAGQGAFQAASLERQTRYHPKVR